MPKGCNSKHYHPSLWTQPWRLSIARMDNHNHLDLAADTLQQGWTTSAPSGFQTLFKQSLSSLKHLLPQEKTRRGSFTFPFSLHRVSASCAMSYFLTLEKSEASEVTRDNLLCLNRKHQRSWSSAFSVQRRLDHEWSNFTNGLTQWVHSWMGY